MYTKTGGFQLVAENLGFNPRATREYTFREIPNLVPHTRRVIYKPGDALQLPHPRRAIPYSGVNAAYLEAMSSIPLVIPMEESAHQAAKQIADLPGVEFVEIVANHFVIVMQTPHDHWQTVHPYIIDILNVYFGSVSIA